MSKSLIATAATCLAIATFTGCSNQNQPHRADKPAKAAHAEWEIFRPRQLDFSDTLLNRITVPAGFRVNVFARDLEDARMMVVGPDGTVYLTLRDPGEVVALKDTNHDGTADDIKTVAKIKDAHGLAVHDNKLFVAAVHDVYVADLRPDGTLGKPRKIVDDLPETNQHDNRTLAFGPDGLLYITVGSTCNRCEESNPESATILRADPDGTHRKPFAIGLRNTIGFGWHPVTLQMWGMDHGTDFLGNDIPPEELNHLQEGKDYGWPYAYGKRTVDPNMGEPGDSRRGRDKETIARNSEPMTLGYQAHAAPIAMVFYTADAFPGDYRNDAFIAMHGSWNRDPAVGYSVVRLRFSKDGRPEKFEPFATGFLTDGGKTQFARPAGLAVATDGSLLISDDDNGTIFRISYDHNAVPSRTTQ